MATTSMWAVRTRLDHLVKYVSSKEKTTLIQTVIDYTTNEEKTMSLQLVSCINCIQNDPYNSMVQTKELYHDEKEILCYHGYQSFAEGEVTPEQAYQLGVELAEKLWGDRFEVIVSTHLNTDNIHNHFLVNATSCVDGKRYCNTKHDRYMMMKTSDELCKTNGLSVIKEKSKWTRSKGQYRNEQSLRSKVKHDIDEILKSSLTITQFFNQLEFERYSIKRTERNISLCHPQHERYIRLSSLGEEYSLENIKQRILQNTMHPLERKDIYLKKGFDITPYYKKYKEKKLTGIQRLYIHYQYKLGIIPKRNDTRPKYTKELREAIKHLDEISNQTILLCTNDIETLEQLESYQSTLQSEYDRLVNERKGCYYEIKRCTDDTEKDNLKNKAKSYTPRIKKLRKNLKLCEGIKERSIKIKDVEFTEPDKQKYR